MQHAAAVQHEAAAGEQPYAPAWRQAALKEPPPLLLAQERGSSSSFGHPPLLELLDSRLVAYSRSAPAAVTSPTTPATPLTPSLGSVQIDLRAAASLAFRAFSTAALATRSASPRTMPPWSWQASRSPRAMGHPQARGDRRRHPAHQVLDKAHSNVVKNQEAIADPGVKPFTRELLHHPEIVKSSEGALRDLAAATDTAAAAGGVDLSRLGGVVDLDATAARA